MTRCDECGAATVVARTDDGTVLRLEASPSYGRGRWDLIVGGLDGVLLARLPRPSQQPRLLYAEHTVCPVPR